MVHPATLGIVRGLAQSGDPAQPDFSSSSEQHFAMVELIEIKKRERASLRIGRAGDPDGELLRLELRVLLGSFGRDRRFLDFHVFGLNAVRARGQTTPARFAKKPKPIVRRLPFRRMRGPLREPYPEKRPELWLVAGHQETKPIQLRQILTGSAPR